MIWSSGKCNDCGEPFETERSTGRKDVCDLCWQNRVWLVSKPELMVSHIEAIRKIQKAMGYGRGTAKKRIDALRSRLASKEGK